MMKQYELNSPEAVARIIVMMMVTDGDVSPRELEMIDSLKIYDRVGLERKAFMFVARDYCADLGKAAQADEQISLLEKSRIAEIVDCVSDPVKRKLTCEIAKDLMTADDEIHQGEAQLFAQILQRWDM